RSRARHRAFSGHRIVQSHQHLQSGYCRARRWRDAGRRGVDAAVAGGGEATCIQDRGGCVQDRAGLASDVSRRRRRGRDIQGTSAGLALMCARRRPGVLGPFVWDEIHGRDPSQAPVQEWGGITYALAGLDAALGDDWEIVPLIKVGSDLAQRARDYLATLRHLAPDAAVIEVPYPNNR